MNRYNYLFSADFLLIELVPLGGSLAELIQNVGTRLNSMLFNGFDFCCEVSRAHRLPCLCNSRIASDVQGLGWAVSPNSILPNPSDISLCIPSGSNSIR